MYQVAYVSRTEEPVGSRTVYEIVERSRQRNRLFGITGYLFQGEGIFAQVLEGEEGNVRLLSRLIRADNRHSDVHFILQRTAGNRAFEPLSLGFRALSFARPLDGRILSLAERAVDESLRVGECDELVDALFAAARPASRIAEVKAA